MLFNSPQFLIFFPLVTLAYFLIPHKIRYLWLLAASYYFYMCWNPVYVLLLLTSTAITYGSGLLLKKEHTIRQGSRRRDRRKKLWVAISFVSNLSILAFYKYFYFSLDNINTMLSPLNFQLAAPAFDIILPVGISFYTFQALSYTIDVYRKEIPAERNFFRYALFVSFFPQLVAGPIERSKNLLTQLHKRQYFDADRMRSGLMQMLWGFFLKIVIADRAAIFVNQVYNNYTDYKGLGVLVATLLFAVQIYCDFGGYSAIAIGAARVMGFNLMENFNTPYLSQSVSEFWRRWHISLSTWFRDYLYIPLGGNRKGKVRKYINLMIVFLVSGLWHGAGWNFIVWGGLNGIYQIIGELTYKWRAKLKSVLKIDTSAFSNRLLMGIITFILVDFAWIFFRAANINAAFDIIRRMTLTFNPWIFFDGTIYKYGLDAANWKVLIWALLLLLSVSICKYKGIDIEEKLYKQAFWFRWIIYIALALFVIIYGVYGPEFNEAAFIYFQF